MFMPYYCVIFCFCATVSLFLVGSALSFSGGRLSFLVGSALFSGGSALFSGGVGLFSGGQVDLYSAVKGFNNAYKHCQRWCSAPQFYALVCRQAAPYPRRHLRLREPCRLAGLFNLCDKI